MTVKMRKCGELPKDAQAFVSQVNRHRKLVRVVAELLGKKQADVQVKQKVLQQLLEMAFKEAAPAKKEEKRSGPDKLTWNLPPLRGERS